MQTPRNLSNENIVKTFLDKLQSFVHHKCGNAVQFSSRKIRILFRLNDKNLHPFCKMYEGTCSGSANYTGKTKRNVETRWNKDENTNKDSEPAKEFKDFSDPKFDWKILLLAPRTKKLRNILKSSIIALKRPTIFCKIKETNSDFLSPSFISMLGMLGIS